MALYIAETWTLRAADQKYLESFEMWCWRRIYICIWNSIYVKYVTTLYSVCTAVIVQVVDVWLQP
jgi:hypothetical protein